LQAKKSFGQHFLINDHIADDIAASLRTAEITGNVLEVGPGTGKLTRFLFEKKYNIYAVEADRDMVPMLLKNFPLLDGRLFLKDFLDFIPTPVFGEKQISLIGNFPYNISTQILFWMLDWRKQVPEMVGMFQKEVAERIVSKPKGRVYGITSVLMQAYYDCEMLFHVGRENFDPPPNVESAVIRLTRKEGFELGCDEKMFRTVVKTAFGQRRKMLRNTLKPFFNDENLMDDPFFTRRPETLGWQEFVDLTNRIKGKN
jgi:16S rRNA (adenine1518-N6/adenine1519-N6)-dimethyltransferase